MRNDLLAFDFFRDGELYLSEAKNYLEKGEYHVAVRRSQEACELALKGLLRYLGVEYPKVHDVGKVVDRVLEDKLKVGRDLRERLKEISRKLAEEREPSFYGSTEGVPPRRLFDKETAQEAVAESEFVVNYVRSLVKVSR